MIPTCGARPAGRRWPVCGSRRSPAPLSGTRRLVHGRRVRPIGEGPYDFIHPFHRHDFNWRNLKQLDRGGVPVWNARTKARADVGFLADMFAECALRTPLTQIGCETTARVYHTVVHLNPSGLGVLEVFE